MEGRLGQGAGAVLDGPAHAVFPPGLLAQKPQRLEIDGHLGQGPVGEDDAAVAGAGLDADLADALVGSRALSKPAMKASRSSGVLFFSPTSPISPPTETATPWG